jgi:hypothetical protein
MDLTYALMRDFAIVLACRKGPASWRAGAGRQPDQYEGDDEGSDYLRHREEQPTTEVRRRGIACGCPPRD